MNQNNDIKSQVLEKIQTGKINMRPRFYFILKVASLIVVAFLVLLFSSLLISFIIFSLVASGKLFLVGFGARGLLMFFLLFPWPLLIIEVALIVLLEWLIKKFKFGYRTSLSRLVFVILLVSVVVSIIIDITPLHRVLLRHAERRNLPVVGDYYRGIRRPSSAQEIFRGVVSDVGTSSFVLNLKGDDAEVSSSLRYTVILPPNAHQLMVPVFGDIIFVAGQLAPENTIKAYGLRKFLPSDAE